jgi:hypothetical protein
MRIEGCEYPDSRKISIRGGSGDGFRKVFRGENTVGYCDREKK